MNLIATIIIFLMFVQSMVCASLALPPQRPLRGVSDPSKWLSPNDFEKWEKNLENKKNQFGIEILLVILPKSTVADIPSEVITRRIASEWANTDCYGIILYTPGVATSPSITWGGKVIDDCNVDPRVQKEMMQRIENQAKSEENDNERIHASVEYLSDQLRLFLNQNKQFKTLTDLHRSNVFEKYTKRRFSERTHKVLLGTVIIVPLFALLFLVLWLHRRRRIYHFPVTSPIRRFGSPYAAGSGAIINLDSSSSPQHPS